ncbi:MAG TPA: sodium:solute symporter family protein [Vicinamibacterales bacterium]|nr:sodium:solute symporter family protein [Vicinamibacterales bacterium]
MNSLSIAVLAGYALALMALGLWLGRRVRGSSDFFVAGRRLGPGLIFSTMLAANIGAGSTVGATAEGYRNGLAAWWWVGSAAIGSTILAFTVGPAIRRIAERHQLNTVGDFLEFRYDRRVRATISGVLWIGSIFILASQLIGLGWILNVVANVPAAIGCAVGGVVVTAYFAAGGLLTSARVNVVQLAVKMTGFAIAVPLVWNAANGWTGIGAARDVDPGYWQLWRPDVSLGFLIAYAPAFIVSPGLLQKVFGARDDRAVRTGVGLNAVGLFLYAGVPVVLGIAARVLYGPLADSQQALPTVLVRPLPALVGALGIAAVFSAEISAADAVLLMLTTSLSQDLYKRFLAPHADDARVLSVARWATLVSGALGVALAITSASIVQVLTIFYTLLTVTLFVPVVAGLYSPATKTVDALASIWTGVAAMAIIYVLTDGAGWGLVTPAAGGLTAAIAAWGLSHVVVSHRRHRG